MADKMMRVAGRFVDNLGNGYSKAITVDQQGVQLVSQISKNKDTVDFLFGGNNRPTITTAGSLTSAVIDVRKYKKVGIILKMNVETRENDSTVEVLTTFPREEVLRNAKFYDWNKGEWAVSTDNRIPIPYSGNNVLFLSLHPNLYWLNEDVVEKIAIRLNVNSEPFNPNARTFEAWIVGEQIG